MFVCTSAAYRAANTACQISHRPAEYSERGPADRVACTPLLRFCKRRPKEKWTAEPTCMPSTLAAQTVRLVVPLRCRFSFA